MYDFLLVRHCNYSSLYLVYLYSPAGTAKRKAIKQTGTMNKYTEDTRPGDLGL